MWSILFGLQIALKHCKKFQQQVITLKLSIKLTFKTLNNFLNIFHLLFLQKILDWSCYNWFNKEVSVITDFSSGKSIMFFSYNPDFDSIQYQQPQSPEGPMGIIDVSSHAMWQN